MKLEILLIPQFNTGGYHAGKGRDLRCEHRPFEDIVPCPNGCAAANALESAQKLSVLHDNNVARLPKPSRSKDNLRALFDYLEQHPIIDIKRTAAELSISYNTAATAVRKLQELEILKETTNAARNRVFAYEDYLHILRQGT